MWELIYSQFHEDKAPKTWLSPKISIRISQGDIVVNQADMVEDSNWRYYYDFVDYDKKKLYLIDVDGWSDVLDDRYQHIVNELDSYKNKQDWKGSSWGAIQKINTREIARDVRDFRESQAKDGTIAKHIYNLDTESIKTELWEKIDNIEIPDNTKNFEDIQENIIDTKETIQWSIEKSQEKVVDTIKESQISIEKCIDGINTNQDKISSKVDNVSKCVSEIEQFDYERIEKKIENEKIDIKPIIDEIEWLKRSIIDEVKNNNYSSMKEFVVNNKNISSLKTEFSQSLIDIRQEFNQSILEIKKNIDKLSEKEIDFSPVLNEIIEVSKQLNEKTNEIWVSEEETQKQLEEQYKKSMKYIIYIAKNIWTITKNDIQEIKTLLSLNKK